MVWFMLWILVNPLTLLAMIVPLAGMGAVYAWAFRLCGGAGLGRRAARWALIVSWLSLLGWMIEVLYEIAASTNSTAMLGVIEMPYGILPAVAILPIAWAVSLVVLALVGPRPGEQGASWSLVLASGIVVLTAVAAGVLCASRASPTDGAQRDGSR